MEKFEKIFQKTCDILDSIQSDDIFFGCDNGGSINFLSITFCKLYKNVYRQKRSDNCFGYKTKNVQKI